MTKFRLDNSKLQDYRRCETYFYFKHIRGFISELKIPALEFGKAIHKALDRRALGFSLEDAIETFKEAYPEELSDKHTLKAAEFMLKEYYERYSDDTLKYSAIEVGLEAEIIEDLWYYVKIDKLAYDNSEIFVLDHKTMSRNEYGWQFKAALSDQFIGNVWTLRQNSINAVGAIADGLILPLKSGETRCLRTPIIRFSKFQIENWYERMKLLIPRVKMLYDECEHTILDRSTNNCIAFNRECSYKELCLIPMRPQDFSGVPGGFKIEFWEPWKEDLNLNLAETLKGRGGN